MVIFANFMCVLDEHSQFMFSFQSSGFSTLPVNVQMTAVVQNLRLTCQSTSAADLPLSAAQTKYAG